MSVFKACDVRGVYPDDWNASDARDIGRSLGAMLAARQQTTVGVGGDFRRTTPEIISALIESLVEAGLQVIELGQLPTPVAYFAARKLALDNLAIVTASHNPGSYNGIKLMLEGRPAIPELINELERGVGGAAVSDSGGAVTARDLVPDYVADMSNADTLPTPAELPKDGVLVVLDTLRGAATHVAPRVLAGAGYSVHSLCDSIDPDYSAGAPNPADDACLDRLAGTVVEQGADVGVALDGDGDRVVFVTHSGAIVRPEQIAALMMTRCYSRPTIVYDLKCASMVSRIAAELDGRAIMRPSGYGFIKDTMISERADLGVEVSGHHFFGSIGGGDDALLAALVVLGLVSGCGETLEDLVRPFPWPEITRDLRIPFEGDASRTLDQIAAACTVPVSRVDGIRAEYPGGWALARVSITEPVMTFRFEGRERQDILAIATEFLAPVPQLCAQVLERIG